MFLVFCFLFRATYLKFDISTVLCFLSDELSGYIYTVFI